MSQLSPALLRDPNLKREEWQELFALKDAISANIAAINPDSLERFSELFARSLIGKGDRPQAALSAAAAGASLSHGSSNSRRRLPLRSVTSS